MKGRREEEEEREEEREGAEIALEKTEKKLIFNFRTRGAGVGRREF